MAKPHWESCGVAAEKAALMQEVLTDLGGKAEAHEVSDEAIEAAAAASAEPAES